MCIMKPTEAEPLRRLTALLWLRVWVYCRCAAAAQTLTPSSMWEPGASLSLAEPPVFPSQWGTGAAVSPFPGWENNPPCLEDKGHGGKPLTGRERGRGLLRWEYFKLVHWCFHAVCNAVFHTLMHMHSKQLCCKVIHTQTHTYRRNTTQRLWYSHTHITVEQPGDTVSWVPFIAPSLQSWGWNLLCHSHPAAAC